MNIEQPGLDIYKFKKNSSRNGFGTYYNQVNETLGDDVRDVLVIGQGDNIVPSILRACDLEVDTFDILADMEPTYVGDILQIDDIVHKQYDCILCCEVLEHLPFDKFELALSKLNKISRKKVIISLPVFGLAGYIKIWAPKYINFTMMISIPFYKPGRKVICDKHYWEINSKGTPQKLIKNSIAKYFKITKQYRVKDEPYHFFYILEPLH